MSDNKHDDDTPPDPSEFMRMRHVREGETDRISEYLPSANPESISPRKKKVVKKKWTPRPTTENQRPDEWVGSKSTRRSWVVKRVSHKKPESDDDDDDEEDQHRQVAAASPRVTTNATTTAGGDKKGSPPRRNISVESDWKPSSAAAAPKPSAKASGADEKAKDADILEALNNSSSVMDMIGKFSSSSTSIGTRSPQRRSYSSPVLDYSPTAKRVSSSNVSPNLPEPESTSSVEQEDKTEKEDSSEGEAEESTTEPLEAPTATPVEKKTLSPPTQVVPKVDDDSDDDYEKPNPEEFMRMRHVRDVDANRIDEFLPSSREGQAAAAGSRRRSSGVLKKWNPTPTAENSRPDEWVGSPGGAKRSWKVKSEFKNNPPPPEPVNLEEESAHTQEQQEEQEDKEPATEATKEPSKESAAASAPVTAEEDNDSTQFEVDSVSSEEQENDKEVAPVSAANDNESVSVSSVASDDDEDEDEETEQVLKASSHGGSEWEEETVEDEFEEVTVDGDDESSAVERDSEDEEDSNPLTVPSPEPKVSQEPPPIEKTETEAVVAAQEKTEDADSDKPDPQEFMRMRHVRGDADTNRVDEYLPSANPEGVVRRQRVSQVKKKWQPKPTAANARPDDWVGGGRPKRKSWVVKSVISKPKSDSEDSD